MSTSSKTIGLFALAFLINFSVLAQVRGTTSSVSGNLSFQEKFNDVTLDPNPLTGPSSRVQFSHNFSSSSDPNIKSGLASSILKEVGVDVPDWIFDLSAYFCFGISPSFHASASVNAGAYYEIHSVGNSEIEVNYPVNVSITYPEENTFGCGDVIKIETALSILDPGNTNKLKVTPPFFNQEIGPHLSNLSFNTTIGLEAWIGVGLLGECAEIDSWGTSKTISLTPTLPPILSPLPPLVNICESAFGPEANEASLLACNLSQATPLLQMAQYSLNAFNNAVPGHYSFAYFSDNTVEIETPDLPEGGPTLPDLEGEFHTVVNSDLKFHSLESGRKLKVSNSGLVSSTMNIDLVSLLDYANVTTSLSLGGNLGSLDIGDVAPTFTAKQNMNFEYSPVVHLTINLGREMNYSVYNSDGTLSHSSEGNVVDLIAGQYIQAQFPQDCSDPVDAWGESKLSGSFNTNVSQDYFESLRITVGKVNFSGLELNVLERNIGNNKFDSDVIMNHDFRLELSDALTLPSYVLDPEKPVININYLGVEDARYLGSGEQAVVYKLGIANGGDVKLNDLKLDFNLSQIYSTAAYSVECLYSGDFNVNSVFDGKTDFNLFAAGNSLDVGESGYVEVLVKVRPEIAAITNSGCFVPVEYEAMAKAYGVSPIGTHVENNFYQCTGERTGPDITATVDLGASIIEDINDFTIYGWDNVKIDKTLGMSMGNVGSGGDVIFENSSLYNNAKTVIIGDIHAGQELFIQGQSKVEANYISTARNVKSPNWKSLLILNGALSENSSCVPYQPVIRNSYARTKSKETVVLRKGETMSLSPGDYEQVTLGEGVQLILSSGEYNIDRWMFLGDDAKITYNIENGPVKINLGVWQALNRRNLKFVVEGQGGADDVIYNYGGNQKCSFSASIVQGRIYAPEAEIEFSDGAVLEGSCYASRVNFKTGASFKGLEYLKPLKINSDCQNILIPGETKSGLIARDNPSEDKLTLTDYGLKVYPNPTKKYITLSGLPEENSVQIQIYNSTGQLIKQLISNPVEMQINLENQPQGLYYLKVEGFKSVTVVKL